PVGGARRLPVVLRALRQAAARGIHRAHGHREAVAPGVRALPCQPRAAHLPPLRRGAGAPRLNARLEVDGREVRIDLARPFDLGVELDFQGPQPRHFGAPRAGSQPFSVPGFPGSVAHGASCNCESITLIPHCNGTHTECAGHLTREPLHAHRIVPRGLVPALLLSAKPVRSGQTRESSDPAPHPDDLLVTRGALEGGWPAQLPFVPSALLIRTLPNEIAK